MQKSPSIVYLPLRGLARRAGVAHTVVTRLLAQGTIFPDFVVEHGETITPVFHPDRAVDVLRNTRVRARL